ncbi:hypothetical protein PybrP1_005699 [[Pythium] brassicae (nom. inval.)]|nr:hypothetical protein PybrP1_005699 [[Pythium] brassicae (nom. inval.)]
MMQEHDEPLAARKRLPRLAHNESALPLIESDGGAAATAKPHAGGVTTATSPRAAVASADARAGSDGDRLQPKAPTLVSAADSSDERPKKLLEIASKGGAAPKSSDYGDDDDDDELARTRSSSSDEAEEELPKLPRYQQVRRWVRRVRQTFGTAFLVLVCAVYAVQGFNSFSSLAINYFFKDNLKLEPADALGALACLALSVPDGISTPLGAVCVLLVNSLSAAVIDVVIDARVVEMSRLDPKHGANDLQSISWMAMSLGGVLGSVLSGPATHQLGVRGVFFFAAAGPSVILCFAAMMREPKATTSRRHFATAAKRQLRQLKGAITTPVIWKCALWVFLSGSVSPGYSQIFFYFSTDVLQFSPEFLGTVSAFGFVFLLLGTLVYNAFFKDVSFRRIFLLAQLSLALVSLLDVVLVTRTNLKLGIPDKAFVLGDAVIADVISRLKTMPVLVLCAKLCPKGVEGTLFALLMSISNFSYSVSEFWGAIICHALGIAKGSFDNLWLAIVIRSALKVTPIFFLFLIPATDPQEIVDKLNFDTVADADSSRSGSTGGGDNDDNMDSPGLAGTVRESHAVNGSPIDSPAAARSPDAVV